MDRPVFGIFPAGCGPNTLLGGLCPPSEEAGSGDRAAPVPEIFVSGGEHRGSGRCPGHRKSFGEQRHAPGTDQFIIHLQEA